MAKEPTVKQVVAQATGEQLSDAVMGSPSQGPVGADMTDLEAKFDALQKRENEFEGEMTLKESEADYLAQSVVGNAPWRGMDAYVVFNTATKLKERLDDAAVLGAQGEENQLVVKVDKVLLESMFHIARQHEGKGADAAKKFAGVLEKISVPMADLNELRKELQETAVELEAARRGMSPAQFIEQFRREQAQNMA